MATTWRTLIRASDPMLVAPCNELRSALGMTPITANAPILAQQRLDERDNIQSGWTVRNMGVITASMWTSGQAPASGSPIWASDLRDLREWFNGWEENTSPVRLDWSFWAPKVGAQSQTPGKTYTAEYYYFVYPRAYFDDWPTHQNDYVTWGRVKGPFAEAPLDREFQGAATGWAIRVETRLNDGSREFLRWLFRGPEFAIEDEMVAPYTPRWTVVASGSSSIAEDTTRKFSGNGSMQLNLANSGDNCYMYRTLTSGPGRVSVYFYDDMNENKGSFISIRSSTDPSDPDREEISVSFPNTYFFRQNRNPDSLMDSGVARSLGWHRFELICTPKGSYARISKVARTAKREPATPDPPPMDTMINISYRPAYRAEPPDWPPTASAVNPNLISFQLILIANTWMAGVSHWDLLQVTDIPTPPEPPNATRAERLAAREFLFVESFLASYGGTDFTGVEGRWSAEGISVARGLAGTALAHVLRYKVRGSLGGADRYYDRQKAASLLRKVVDHRLDWVTSGNRGNNLSSVVGSSLALCVKLLGSELNAEDPSLQSDLMYVLRHDSDPNDPLPLPLEQKVGEADYYKGSNILDRRDVPPWGTDGEKNSWAASFLALMAKAFPSEANAGQWESKGRCFAFHSLTRNESQGGCWLDPSGQPQASQQIYTDDPYKMDQHSYSPHPHYWLHTMGELGAGALAYRKAGAGVPNEFKRIRGDATPDVAGMMDRTAPYTTVTTSALGFSNYQWKGDQIEYTYWEANCFRPENKDDWGGDATWVDYAYVYRDVEWGPFGSGNWGVADVVEDITQHQARIMLDYTAFPVGPNVPSIPNEVIIPPDPAVCPWPGGYRDGAYYKCTNAGEAYRWLLNTVNAARHMVSFLHYDPLW